MFTRRKKFESNSGVIKPESRLLRLLRSDTSFQAPLISLERTDQEDGYNEARKEIGNAILEAEYKKAKAIMMMQQHRRTIC
jgi:hypothetical protein